TAAHPIDPRLGPLQNNGGPTPTHALLPGSPALDAGDAFAFYYFDQRGPGYPRRVGPAVDLGAYEVQNPGVLIGMATADTDPGEGVDAHIDVAVRNDDAVSGIAAVTKVLVKLPAGLTLAAATPGVGSYDANTGTWSVRTLAPGTSAHLALTVLPGHGT